MTIRSVGRGIGAIAFGVVLMATVTGCQLWANPFVDPYSGAGPVTTASSAGAFEMEKEARVSTRSFSVTTVSTAEGTVAHGPLYFEDGFADGYVDDGAFAWTGEDYLSVFTWRARFLLNLALFPLSAVDTPPWCIMSSDGRASRRVWWMHHDAEKVRESAPCG